MQTLSIPYCATPEGQADLTRIRRVQSAAIRQVYAQGAADLKTGKAPTETEQRDMVNVRWRAAGVGAMVLQNAVRAGRALRTARPDGTLVFGGKKNLVRRAKGLLSGEEWKALRLRPLELQGNINKGGNYHLVWPDTNPDSHVQTLTLRFPCSMPGDVPGALGHRIETLVPITLDLHTLSNKQRRLLADVFRCASRNDLTLSLRIDGNRIGFTYDPLDLRALPPGQTLVDARAADVAAGKVNRKGRARTAKFKPTPVAAYPETGRPVHPDIKTPTSFHPRRKLGIDLNPEWIGVTVLEHSGNRGSYDDLRAYEILDYRLIRWDLNHFDLRTREGLAQAVSVATQRVISLARSWNVGEIALEDKLGLLHTHNRGKTTNRKNNTWARSKFCQSLTRRATLAGITVMKVNAAYSTTIGNVGFGALWDIAHPESPHGLPDACASAAEIARRAFIPDSVLREAREQDRKSPDPVPGPMKNAPSIIERAFTAPRKSPLSCYASSASKTASVQKIVSPLKHRDGQTNISAWMQAWLPIFDKLLLQCDRWKETAAGSSDWVDAHGKIKTAKGFRRPHMEGFISPLSRSVDVRPRLDGHEVVALGYATRPGWCLRPGKTIDRRQGRHKLAESISVNTP